ncbi:MAG: ankyrin repeat domain-containing protein [Thermodesulfobacteriota bacterium]
MSNCLSISVLVLAVLVHFPQLLPAEPTRESALMGAIKSADIAAVEEAITGGADVNVRDPEHLTPLIWACAAGRKDIVEALIDAGADVDERGPLGFTALGYACRTGNVELVRLLIGRGANVNARSEPGWSPLFFAALSGSKDITTELLSSQADPHARNFSGSTPLLIAADLGREEVAKLLVRAGSEINAQNEQGTSPLILAAYRGHANLVKFFLENGADPNIRDRQGRTPLMFASMVGFEEIVQLLLTAGSNVEASTVDGETALTLAQRRGNRAIAAILEGKQSSGSIQLDSDTALRSVRDSRTAAVLEGSEPDVIVVKRASKISQLAGEWDRERAMFTKSRTLSTYKLIGTDLGAPFRHKDRIYLLFGDTGGMKGGDAIAYTDITARPEEGLDLTFVHDGAGVYIPVKIPGISQGNFEVPMEGVSVGGSMYIYHTTDHTRKRVMGRSVVAVSRDDGKSFRYLYDFSLQHFINVSVVKVQSADWNGLPDAGESGLVIFGSGPYRESSVRLAFQPGRDIENPSAIRYFSGTDPSGTPLWSAREQDAQELFHQACVGELSVSYNRFIRKWIMLYNCTKEFPGVLMRTSDFPWGPWSKPQVLFHVRDDDGFCNFIHRSWDEKRCDFLSDPGRERHSGDAYGPYQFEDLAVGDRDSTTIYFTLSTWNPYTVVLMKATLKRIR